MPVLFVAVSAEIVRGETGEGVTGPEGGLAAGAINSAAAIAGLGTVGALVHASVVHV